MSEMMLISTKTMRKVANYIEVAGSIINGAEALEQKLAAAVPGAVDGLVDQGILSPHMKEAKVKEFTNDPSEMAQSMTKLAAAASVRKPIGEGADETHLEVKSADEVFLDTLMGGREV